MSPFFKDISNFNKVSDYLPILVGVFTVETFVIFFTFTTSRSKVLEYWYKTYGLSAVMADVIIVIIGMIITRFLYPFIFKEFSIWKFVGLALGIQMTHDILFYNFFSLVPKGYNRMIDTFKKYGREVGGYAILGDSLIIIFSCLIASNLANYSFNTNIVSLLFSLYFIPYLIYHK
jgi:hypothetical protein|uniref:Uncharacterized protein n=1 Tax=viral metagenome TaxID=1070528 RepID=A0A6C0HS21_9ZZZZ